MVDYKIPRCQIVPEADSQTSFTLDGMELFRWHYGGQYPRPFFHPVNGPSGANLVRMGHPGAPNHDHHAGIWFAYNSIESFDFWANGTETQIRQRQWLDYIDGDDYAAMAVILDYYDGHEDRPLLNQQTVVALRPLPNEEYLIEIQLELQSPQGVVNLNQTNYGIIAVRVGGFRLRSILVVEGSPILMVKLRRPTSSEGRQPTWITVGLCEEPMESSSSTA